MQGVKWPVSFLLIAAIIFGMAATSLAAENDRNGLGVSDLNLVAQVVKSQYVDSVDEYALLTGAHEGIRSFLKVKKLPDNIEDLPKGISWSKGLNFIQDEFNYVVKKYPKEVKETDLLYSTIKGMVASVKDPYTMFMDPKEYKALMEQMSGGNFGGIGIYIDVDQKKGKQLVVVEPIEDTPAYKAGLKAGDFIMKIDGKSTEGFTTEMAQNVIRGPLGTSVALTIKRGEVIKDYSITRALIHVKSVSSKIIDNNIGYIKLRMFGESTNSELTDVIKSLEQRQVKGFVLDLRNNGGGYITAALDVCSKFLPRGSLIVSVIDKNGHRQSYYADGSNNKTVPLVVLVNNFSASASEITAGALKDQGVTVLIGQKTFGKGSVQNIQPLRDGSALKLTIAKYTTPSGREIDKKGLEPDIPVEMQPDLVDTPQDVQLKKALEHLRSHVAKK